VRNSNLVVLEGKKNSLKSSGLIASFVFGILEAKMGTYSEIPRLQREKFYLNELCCDVAMLQKLECPDVTSFLVAKGKDIDELPYNERMVAKWTVDAYLLAKKYFRS
jgi:hypothetical protein